MITPERLKERAEALWAFERAGGRVSRLIWLDGRVRGGGRTDWPGRHLSYQESRTFNPFGYPGATLWRAE